MEEFYLSTLSRIDALKREHGYEVHVKWECEFREELKRDPELKKEFDNIFIPPVLDHRVHTLRGGRTEPFEFKHECSDDEQILLLDIVSIHDKLLNYLQNILLIIGLALSLCNEVL